MNTNPNEVLDDIAACITEKVERAKLETAYTENLRKIPNPITSDEE